MGSFDENARFGNVASTSLTLPTHAARVPPREMSCSLKVKAFVVSAIHQLGIIQTAYRIGTAKNRITRNFLILHYEARFWSLARPGATVRWYQWRPNQWYKARKLSGCVVAHKKRKLLRAK